MKLFVDDNYEPTRLAYVIGATIGVALTALANSILGWTIPLWLLPLSAVLAIFGVLMIETGCEAVVVLTLASIPLAFLLWHRPEYSLGKQVWLSALVAHGSGKLWVGFIR